jgi:BlaI family transcriptional regulator, penicillinase repressor
MSWGSALSRRERQIMEVLFARGEASAAEVQEAMPDSPGYSAIRALLRILEDKGHVQHVKRGRSYVYRPLQAHETAARSALRQVVQTFFGGRLDDAVAALVSDDDAQISDEELKALAALIEQAREERQ